MERESHRENKENQRKKVCISKRQKELETLQREQRIKRQTIHLTEAQQRYVAIDFPFINRMKLEPVLVEVSEMSVRLPLGSRSLFFFYEKGACQPHAQPLKVVSYDRQGILRTNSNPGRQGESHETNRL